MLRMGLSRSLYTLFTRGSSVLFRSAVSGYKDALRNAEERAASAAAGTKTAAPAANDMSVMEAKKILALDNAQTITEKDILARYNHLRDANDPIKGGSPYIRTKVATAMRILENNVKDGES